MFGHGLQHRLGGVEDLGPDPLLQGDVQGLDLRRGGLLAGFDVAAGGGQGRRGRACGEPLGPVELVVGAAELAPAGLVQGRLPRLGRLTGATQRGAADLVPGQPVDPLDDPRGFPRVEVGPDLRADGVGQFQPGGREGVGGGAQPLGQVQILDRAGEVVGVPATAGAGDQVEGQPVAELDRVVVVGDLGAVGQGQRLIEAPGPRRLLRLPQDDSPLSQHG
ncbi:MAG: hypothetical protein U0835_26065 [Isosphaeraceae bacterium]